MQPVPTTLPLALDLLDRQEVGVEAIRENRRAPRLGSRRMAAFDRGPLAVVRPRHVPSLDLEP